VRFALALLFLKTSLDLRVTLSFGSKYLVIAAALFYFRERDYPTQTPTSLRNSLQLQVQRTFTPPGAPNTQTKTKPLVKVLNKSMLKLIVYHVT
jgi:hypothetical protein